ncbi:ATP-dependent zinc protease [Marinobacter sp. TBZ242]|uniref:ATP-dependent zinc protease n=1 Tax=Marinobacter azerbaijanicus TaxID=3050455 RepID=A0ABT7I5Z5_9GAMM|nr:ATP-dependent zinc protease [Marinobacter sp. TBZ242]MDL0429504.1 ATP-dependent zinc protease [Marinobacter sp. TBZ242]
MPETLGFVEWMVLKESGLRLKARLDTGARTSSLHAINVEPFEKGEKEWVRFQLPLADHQDKEDADGANLDQAILEFTLPIERTVKIKRKGAPSQHRYVVDMEFCIAGSMHRTEFTLADRSAFTYPALLGRRFMSDDNILIDSSDSFLAPRDCEHKSLAEVATKHSD